MFSFDQAKGITCVSSTIEKYKMNGENMDLVSELEISLIVSWKGCKNFNSKRCEQTQKNQGNQRVLPKEKIESEKREIRVLEERFWLSKCNLT